jgi:hypothetical protein
MKRPLPWSIPRANQPAAPLPVPELRTEPVPRLAISAAEVAAALGVGLSTLSAWQREGIAPPSIVIKGGRRRLYPVDSVRAWLRDLASKGESCD